MLQQHIRTPQTRQTRSNNSDIDLPATTDSRAEHIAMSFGHVGSCQSVIEVLSYSRAAIDVTVCDMF